MVKVKTGTGAWTDRREDPLVLSDEETISPKCVRRGGSNYPPCPMAVPAKGGAVVPKGNMVDGVAAIPQVYHSM